MCTWVVIIWRQRAVSGRPVWARAREGWGAREPGGVRARGAGGRTRRRRSSPDPPSRLDPSGAARFLDTRTHANTFPLGTLYPLRIPYSPAIHSLFSCLLPILNCTLSFEKDLFSPRPKRAFEKMRVGGQIEGDRTREKEHFTAFCIGQ